MLLTEHVSAIIFLTLWVTRKNSHWWHDSDNNCDGSTHNTWGHRTPTAIVIIHQTLNEISRGLREYSHENKYERYWFLHTVPRIRSILSNTEVASFSVIVCRNHQPSNLPKIDSSLKLKAKAETSSVKSSLLHQYFLIHFFTDTEKSVLWIRGTLGVNSCILIRGTTNLGSNKSCLGGEGCKVDRYSGCASGSGQNYWPPLSQYRSRGRCQTPCCNSKWHIGSRNTVQYLK